MTRRDGGTVEQCAECGFDGGAWTDAGAVEAVGHLGERWAAALAGLPAGELQRRPITDMWSIVEYTDHVREVLFAMRFVVDAAVAEPGVHLGDPPSTVFSDVPRPIDPRAALEGLTEEATALAARLRQLPEDRWTATAFIGEDEIDVHWIGRHALHDADHHLGDVRRLRAAL